MDIFIKGVSFPVTFESLDNDLNSDNIVLRPNPCSTYFIFRSESDGIVFEHFIKLGLTTFSFRCSISLCDVREIIVGVLENRLFL